MILFFLQSCFFSLKPSGEPFLEDSGPKGSILSEDDLVEVEAQVEYSGVISCENPSLRADNSLYLASLGAEWDHQPVEGFSPEEGFWFGGEGIAVGDFTEDNLLDIFVPTLDKNLMFIQQVDGSFDERSDELLPIEAPTLTVGASFADYDGDYDLDIFVLNILEPNQLLENQGEGFFVDRSMELGIVQNSYYYPGSIWGDLDHDGDLDLFVLTTGSGPMGPPPWSNPEHFEPAGPNRLYINQSGTSFDLQSLPNHTPEPYSCCAAFLDINLDYLPDLYIVNDFGMYVQPNQLFLGTESGELLPDYGSGIDIGMYGMGLGVGDINTDSYPDFIVSDWGRNWLFLSDGFGEWYDATLTSGLTAQHPDQHVGWGVEIHDVDNDGFLDVWVAYGQLDISEEEQESFDELGLYNPRYQPDALYLFDEGTYTDVAAEWGINRTTISRGGIWADLNNDGFLDLISAAVDGPVQVYLANCDTSAWIRIQLIQPSTFNTDAIGAKVRIKTRSGTQTRWILAGTSLSSAGPLEAHFGLGEDEQIEEIQILWPDQTISTVLNIEVNQILQITKME
jgi:hypothetical protein